MNWLGYVIILQVLGVSPIERFDMIKAAYTKKKKEAEMNGDEATASRVRYLSNFQICEVNL